VCAASSGRGCVAVAALQEFDVAIVGAGIVGASVAAALGAQAPALRVVLLEAEAGAGSHSTGRSAAMYEPSYGPPQVRALTRASLGALTAPPPGFATVPLLHARDSVFVADAKQRAGLGSMFETLRAEGLPVRWLDGAAVRARVPVLREAAAVAAMLDTSSSDIDVDALLQGFLRAAAASGAVLATGSRVLGLERRGARWRIGLDSGRSLSAHTLVNAAGAWADEVGALAGVQRIGLQPCRRSAFVFEPPAGLGVHGWPLVIDADETWYFKPDAGLLLGSPANADPVPPHDVVAQELDIATAIARIEAATTLTIRRPRRTWAGLRSFVPDGEPVVGFDRMAPGFFWAAALGGYGIQTSPAVGELAAALLLQQPLPRHLAEAGVRAEVLAPRPAA
jgi:D-arginine dehydrogenase